MTLFYKDKEDVVESEEDPTNVNVGEQCQHCGNESGYTLIGKVGEAEQEEAAEVADETAVEEAPAEETPEEETAEETTEETTDGEEDLSDIDLDGLDLDLEEPAEEEEKTEESFTAHEGEALVEELSDDKELDAKLNAHNEYIAYLRNAISEEEKELEKTDNEQVKAAIQRRIDAFKADLEAALPDEVKNELVAEDAVEEPVEESEAVEETTTEGTSEEPTEEIAEEPVEEALDIYGNVLTEALHEEADLEVSADEFEELINSPEFKKPVSDTAVRAMINAEKDEEKNVEESLEEGLFDGIPLTRAGKADWLLANARTDYNNIKTDAKGKLVKDEANQKFKAFMVYYFKGNFRKNKDDIEGKGKAITTMPEQKSYKDMIPADRAPDIKQKYAEVDSLAKGWSQVDGNGPALVFLVSSKNDENKALLCAYFDGKLVQSMDTLDSNVEKVKASIAGMKKMAKGAAGQASYKDVKTSDVKVDDQIQYKNEMATVTEIDDSDDKNFIFKLKVADGTVKSFVQPKNGKVKKAITLESLDTVMSDIEELNEAALEKLISDSLVEAYGNIAGYKLTDCEYLNEKFNVNGTIYFTSGKTRKTTYSFSEAVVADDRITLVGLNEKLGLEKQFVLTGSVENKTLITESFKRTK
jgi:hypothetical protein